MTNKMINNEMMSFEDLDRVSGGTIAEMKELRTALYSKGVGGDKVAMNAFKIVEALENKLGNNGPANLISAYAIEHALNKCYGVKANISVGLFGTGRGEKNNTYDGRTHQQVLDLINK